MSTTELQAEFLDAMANVNRRLRIVLTRGSRNSLTLARARMLLALIEQEWRSFIERRSVQGDRRAKRVVMTDEGRVLAEQVVKLADDVRGDLLENVGDEELNVVIDVLRKMSVSMNRTHR